METLKLPFCPPLFHIAKPVLWVKNENPHVLCWNIRVTLGSLWNVLDIFFQLIKTKKGNASRKLDTCCLYYPSHLRLMMIEDKEKGWSKY